MVSSRSLNKIFVPGALLIAGCCLVLSYPQSKNLEDEMMSDDYEYMTDDFGGPSPQVKPSVGVNDAAPHTNRSVTVTGILGEDVVLKCDEKMTKDSVILWYKGSSMIATGKSIVQPNYSLDVKSFDLTILKSSPQSAGDYYCEVLPQKVFLHTKVILGEHSLDVITPESSKSAQSSLHQFALMWLLSAFLVLQQYKH